MFGNEISFNIPHPTGYLEITIRKPILLALIIVTPYFINALLKG